jgi:MOSC domain-containing protein YiiM
MTTGTVISINITEAEGQPMNSIQEVHAVPGMGLEGDRYFYQTGKYSDKHGAGRQVTLIEIEAVEALKREEGIDLPPGDARRNIVTRGVPLNHLVGIKFRVGEVTLQGVRLAEPCGHLAVLTQLKVEPALVHRGGLRADILTDGVIRVGDVVQALD